MERSVKESEESVLPVTSLNVAIDAGHCLQTPERHLVSALGAFGGAVKLIGRHIGNHEQGHS